MKTATASTPVDLTAKQAEVEAARIALHKAKVLYGNKMGSYDAMVEAAKWLAELMFEYQKVRFPNIKPKRIPYQAILR